MSSLLNPKIHTSKPQVLPSNNCVWSQNRGFWGYAILFCLKTAGFAFKQLCLISKPRVLGLCYSVLPQNRGFCLQAVVFDLKTAGFTLKELLVNLEAIIFSLINSSLSDKDLKIKIISLIMCFNKYIAPLELIST
jgi:hypothetical protein